MEGKLVFLVLAAIVGVTLAEEPTAFPEDVREGITTFGWEAAVGQFPYQLNLRSVDRVGTVYTCGASLIHFEWGLTAAHCTAGRISFVVRGGMVNLTRPTAIFETTEYYTNPLYDESLAGVVQPHDISLLALGRALRFTVNLQPIRMQNRLSRNRNYQGVQLVASGWGHFGGNGMSSENLSWVYLQGSSNIVCALNYGATIVTSSTVCASESDDDNLSACQAESGGPLTVVDDDGRVTLVGVTSFVHLHGCNANRPAGFIRPGHYHDWFNAVTGLDFDWR